MVSVSNSSNIAIVIGASGGIGAAIANALTARDAEVFQESRSQTGLDITDEASIAERAANVEEALGGRTADLIFIATGVLAPPNHGPEKAFAAIDAGAMAATFAVNAFGPALIVKHFAPLLARDRRVVLAALSARVGSIGDNRLGGWMSYRASKAALNQFMRCAAIEFKRTHKQSVFAALHPGTIETPLTRAHARGRYTASAEEAATNLLKVLDNLSPEATGGFYAYDGQEIPW
ncbi:MAG: SDR family NAD(P)-dependent oxidoreductase [Pseudomonadota bacterium]